MLGLEFCLCNTVDVNVSEEMYRYIIETKCCIFAQYENEDSVYSFDNFRRLQKSNQLFFDHIITQC